VLSRTSSRREPYCTQAVSRDPSPVVRNDPNRVARSLFSGLGPRYDLLAEVLSFGQNGRWRREAVRRVAEGSGVGPDASAGPRPSLLLDVATGTAGVALESARRTGASVIGVDLTEQMLRRGAANVGRACPGAGERVALVAARAEELPFPDGCFDGMTFSYLLRYVADPAATLRELARVVRPGGAIASLEFHVPPKRFWRFWWWLYTRLVLPAAGLLSGGREWYRVGRFLGPSISGHYRRYPLEATVGAWRDAGITGVDSRLMSLGGGVVIWGDKTGG